MEIKTIREALYYASRWEESKIDSCCSSNGKPVPGYTTQVNECRKNITKFNNLREKLNKQS